MAKFHSGKHGYPDLLVEMGLITGITERVWM